MKTRLLVLVVLVAAVGILTATARSTATTKVVAPVTPVGPHLPSAGATGVTWYCAAGSAPSGSTVSQELILANRSGAKVTALVSAVTSHIATPTTVAVGARSAAVIAAPVADASYIVEVSGPDVVVSHRLVAGSSSDEAPCASAGASNAYFPTADTQTNAGADAQLWLFNPFPSDASLDVTVVTPDGVRIPSKLSGVVVPGGSTLSFDLGKIEQRRDEFALSVVTRSGLIVAELSQTNGAPAGLELVPGVQSTAQRWIFADGESGTGISERYVVYNPSSRDASVLLQVFPYNSTPAQLPEPFDLDVPPRSFVTTDMEHQTRVTQDQPHWVQVDSTNHVGVTVERLTTMASGNPDGLSAGAAVSLGQTVTAEAWLTPWADRDAASTSYLSVANPSADTIAKVEVRSFGAGKLAGGSSVLKAEVGPGHSARIDLGAAGADPRGLEITSSSPVVVERHALEGSADLSVIPAIPISPYVSVAPLVQAAAPGGGG